MSDEIKPGVSAMSAYVPPFRVQLRDWCDWTGNSWDKIQAVVGSGFRVCGEHENVYTMVDGFEGGSAKSGPQKGSRVVNGWKNSGLPWRWKLDSEKMYVVVR